MKLLLVILPVLLFVSGIPSAVGDNPASLTINENLIRAVYAENLVTLSLPIENTTDKNIISNISLKILDFSDSVIGSSQKATVIKIGSNNYDFILSSIIPLKDLYNYRLHYTVSTKNQDFSGYVSFLEIIQRMETRLIGPREIYAGSQVAYRVFTRNMQTGEPIPDVILTMFMIGKSDTAWICEGITNENGVAELAFIAPDSDGTYDLQVSAEAPFFKDNITQTITVKKSGCIYLVTDKPIYQPGQTMYFRSLALSRFRSKPLADQDAKFLIYDARGNRVFKYITKTDRFGVMAASFILADEVNFGTYKVEATVGGDVQAKTVEVKRYVLPKFKVDISTEREYYKPGARITGKVKAEYFFGKTVSQAKVVIKAMKHEVDWVECARIEGKTDKDGGFEFAINAPRYFVGQPFEQGQSGLRLDVSITDAANHEETAVKSIVIAKDDIVIRVIPVWTGSIPEKRLYIITTYPDGQPVKAELNLTAKTGSLVQNHLYTDQFGLAEVTVQPDRSGKIALSIRAFDRAGNQSLYDYEFIHSAPADYIAISIDHTLYKTGDMVRISILSSVKNGPVFIDLIKQGQVINGKTLDVVDGKAGFELALSTDYEGLLTISAYQVLPTGQIIRDIQRIFIDPLNDLSINAEPDQKSYLPGADAEVDFMVTDKSNNPVVACLGISIVDEAVFALSEMRPGLEKVYFMLEQELMTPRWEIHGFETVDIVRFGKDQYNYNTEERDARERAARFLLSPQLLSPGQLSNMMDVDTRSKNTPDTRELMVRVQNRAADDLKVIAMFLYDYPWVKDKKITKKGIEKAIQTIAHEKRSDPWGVLYEISITQNRGDWFISLRSAGPDKKFATDDDIVTRSLSCVNPLVHRPAGELVKIYDDQPSRFGLITGMVKDAETYEPILGANVVIEGTLLGAASDERGNFQIPYIPPGYYSVTCSNLGFEPYTITDLPVMAGKRTDIFYRITPSVIAIKGVTAVAVREPIITSQTQTSHAITYQEGNRLPVTAIGQVALPTEEPRVRKYFPETFLFEPALITDSVGAARMSFMMPDNITTWRMSMMGSDLDGRMGSGTKPLLVFKDFFIDLDLPVSLTCEDEISLPVAIYNYLKEPMSIRIEITEDDWFSLKDEAVKEITIDRENVGVVYFRIRAREFGEHKILVKGYTAGNSDAIQKKVLVVPDGKRESAIISGRLIRDQEQKIDFPAGTIPGTQKILVRFYPGILSQLVDGLDGLLRMPSGCFEQTTSITYPNVLILDFLRKAHKRVPETEMRALQYISTGYQRLLSYETPSGGFSWWGNAPGNKLLTAYGLMEFRDMKEVFDIDEKIIERTIQWFLKQQEKSGAWSLDPSYLHEEVWGKFKNAEILPTAFITWALLEAGYKGKEVIQAMDYIKRNVPDVEDPYALALVANALALYDPKDQNLDLIFTKLVSRKIEEGDRIRWSSGISSMTNSSGSGADIETSSLITLALIRTGKYPDIQAKAINYLNASKSPSGGWVTTQGTVFALKALLASARTMTEKVDARISVILNGEKIHEIHITPEQSDVVRMISLNDNVEIAGNTVRLEIRGKGGLLYDIISDFYRSWDKIALPDKPILAIGQEYDKTSLTKDDIIACQVTASNNTKANLQMIIVDLGIPPGFDIIETDLSDLVAKKVFQKYHLMPRQIIIYFDNIPALKEIKFIFHMKAKFPLRAKSGFSSIYDYYNPDKVGLAKPVEFEVQ